MGIFLDTITTMVISSDPMASMMIEVKNETTINPCSYDTEIREVTSSENTLSINMPELSISQTSLDISLFNAIENTEDIHSPTMIVKDACKQIKNLNYIAVDDVIDREIDAFFAKRQLKKAKKIIYKRT